MAHRIAPVTPTIDATDAQMVERREISIPPAVFVGDGSTDTFYVGDKGALRVTQTCSAVSGTTPTCDTTVMTSATADGQYYAAGTFARLSGTGSERKSFAVDRWVRFDIDPDGATPSFTLAFEGEAV